MLLLHQVFEPAKAKPRLKVKIRLSSGKQGLSGCWTTRTMQEIMPTFITYSVSAPSGLDTHAWSHGCLSRSTQWEWKRLKRSNAERLKMNVGDAGNMTKCEKTYGNFLWSGSATNLKRFWLVVQVTCPMLFLALRLGLRDESSCPSDQQSVLPVINRLYNMPAPYVTERLQD